MATSAQRLHTSSHISSRSYMLLCCHMLTRSQAVARIADRTAKNCRGHVT